MAVAVVAAMYACGSTSDDGAGGAPDAGGGSASRIDGGAGGGAGGRDATTGDSSSPSTTPDATSTDSPSGSDGEDASTGPGTTNDAGAGEGGAGSRDAGAGDAGAGTKDAGVADSSAGAKDAGADSGSSGDSGTAAATGPCDIYATGGTPCVAAHSTVRALYGAYANHLYQVRRASDKTTKDVGPLAPGGVADASVQDAFCAGTTCTVSIIYDQSPKANDLKSAPAGGQVPTPDAEASATGLKLTIGGHTAYAVFVNPGVGYRIDKTSGIATGDQAEGEYMVTSGTHFNGGCCFDYGNAETSNDDTGAGHMEAIYFGTSTGWGTGSGAGPWVMADMENGLFSGVNAKLNAGDMTVRFPYVTAMIKGGPGMWAIKAGNAQTGALTTMWNGQRPAGYNPMHKEGAIILGIGGDNSDSAEGTFFEGVMTSGYPTDAAETAVQANIVAAGYGQ